MIDSKRRQEIYRTAFNFMIKNNIADLPINPFLLCWICNIGISPLSCILEESGLTKDEVFSVWGNEDGVIHTYKGSHKIAYNDNQQRSRQLFTITEEISHALLKHTEDPNFNAFTQDFDRGTYLRYEEEARICAGLIICPPQFYYENRNALSKSRLMQECGISESCASTRMSILNRFEDEIKSSALYSKLPQIKLAPSIEWIPALPTPSKYAHNSTELRAVYGG